MVEASAPQVSEPARAQGTEFKFSFLKLFNTRKKIGQKDPTAELDYLQKRASPQQKEAFARLQKWLKDNGV